MTTRADMPAETLLTPFPPKAAQLIVTIYGDIVEPRDGVLWMGDLIGLCAGFGVNESLVRTAVSRLVSKGQLSGQREGRRSFYALTDEAREEYHAAAELFYGAADGECHWIITHCSDLVDQDRLSRMGYLPLGGNVFAGADRPGRPVLGTAFRSVAIDPTSPDLKKLLGAGSDLALLADDYEKFVEDFRTLGSGSATKTDDKTAMLQRLALVHAYRDIRLRDPRLPPSVLPEGWAGERAHRLFAELYTRLSAQADAYIGRTLLNRKGTLEARTDAVISRLESLAARF